jgi:hypothetical protein
MKLDRAQQVAEKIALEMRTLPRREHVPAIAEILRDEFEDIARQARREIPHWESELARSR